MTATTEKQFFDLHISGVGYLNRIREVTPKRGNAFWACDIAALNGPSDDVGYTRFDCRVSGREAETLVKRCEQAVNMTKKVLIGFKLGDLWTDTYTRTKGDYAGETAVSLKARLLFISWIKVDGEKVYEAPRRDEIGTPETPVQDGHAVLQDVASQPQPADMGSVGAAESAVA